MMIFTATTTKKRAICGIDDRINFKLSKIADPHPNLFVNVLRGLVRGQLLLVSKFLQNNTNDKRGTVLYIYIYIMFVTYCFIHWSRWVTVFSMKKLGPQA